MRPLSKTHELIPSPRDNGTARENYLEIPASGKPIHIQISYGIYPFKITSPEFVAFEEHTFADLLALSRDCDLLQSGRGKRIST